MKTLIEDDHILHAGGPYAGAVDARLSARGKLVWRSAPQRGQRPW